MVMRREDIKEILKKKPDELDKIFTVTLTVEDLRWFLREEEEL